MIYNYEIKKERNEEILYIYFDFDNEFAKLKKKSKNKKIKEEINDFINKNNIKFNGKKIMVVASGLAVGMLLLNTPKYSSRQENLITPNYTISALVDIDENIIPESKNEIEEESKNVETSKQNKIDNTLSELQTSKNEVSTKNSTQNIQKSQITTQTQQPVQNTDTSNKQETNNDTLLENKTYVNLIRSNGTKETLELEEYVIGVVGAEMPASFHLEALKSQAILARTYALKAISQNKTLTDNSSTQNYKSSKELKNMWGSNYNTYYQKIKNAVDSTKGKYLTYNGNIIEAVYHSTSNGKTENAKYVWGNSFPYLVSVDSVYDNSNPSFIKEQFFSYVELSAKFNMEINIDTPFIIINLTDGNRIENISISNNNYTGVQIRLILGLRSTDFEISKQENGIIFTTKGYGHGVGMSQYGANGMAKNGSSYVQILKHYYQGVTISQR